jgi:hypothetical protein
MRQMMLDLVKLAPKLFARKMLEQKLRNVRSHPTIS